MSAAAFQLPDPPRRVERRRFGTVDLDVAVLDAAELTALVESLVPPGGSVASRAASIARAARRFRDPADPLRREAEERLPAVSGFSPAMIAETVPLVFAALEEDSIASVIVAAGGAFVRHLAIVAAGNVLGVAVAKTALALAAGVPCIVKVAEGEPLLSVLFARALAEESAELGRAQAALWWPGGDIALERSLAAAVDSLVAYGSDESIAALRALASRRFVGHGHRLSVGVVRLDEPGSLAALATAAARDVALHDQQGCLSPQALFTIGGDGVTQEEFTAALAAALADLAERLPRGRVDDGVHVAIRRLRDQCEWRAIRGEAVTMLCDPAGTGWTVVSDRTPRLRANPLYRTIVVHPVATLSALEAALASAAPRLESIGIAPWPDRELESFAAALGVPRVAALGSMQSPGLDWRQGGLDPLAGLLATAQVRTR